MVSSILLREHGRTELISQTAGKQWWVEAGTLESKKKRGSVDSDPLLPLRSYLLIDHSAMNSCLSSIS